MKSFNACVAASLLSVGCYGVEDNMDSTSQAVTLCNAPKIPICHVPHGDPTEAKTICIAATAERAHVAHGDTPGECPTGCSETGGACSIDTDCCAGLTCVAGACVPICTPAPEVCDGIDNDCDDAVDEGFGVGEACDGADGDFCAEGIIVCDPEGVATCTDVTGTTSDVCGDLVDNDCNGEIDVGCLGDHAWNDTVADGIQAAGEPGESGMNFILRRAGGAVVQTAVSDSNGDYYFHDVAPGDYIIEAVMPTGTRPTAKDAVADDRDSDFDPETRSTGVITFTGEANYTIDIGIVAIEG